MIWEIDDGAPVIEGLDDQGRPDPAYAAALGLVPAPAGRRVLAALVEWLLAALISLPAVLVITPMIIDVVTDEPRIDLLLARPDLVWAIVAYAISSGLMTLYILVQVILHGRRGVTLGKAMFGIRSVNVRTLERPRFWRGAVVRYIVAYASFLIPLIGPLLVIALSPLFDPERRGRGWLDMAAGTWFVDIRRGLNPYDRKRMRVARKMQKASLHEERAPLPSLATPADRDAPAQYVPRARTSGGVLGAHREAAAPTAPAGGVLASGQKPAGPAVPAVVAPPKALPAEPGSMIDNVPPVLGQGSPAPAAVAEPAQEAYAPRAAQPAAAAPAPDAASPVIRPVLVLDTGQRIEVRGVTLIGRAPTGDAAAQLVPVADDTRSVSKTHLAIMPARRGMLVTDQGSTNGSVIVRGGTEMLLAPGRPAELQAGDTVRFGDRSLTVENA